KGSVPGLAHVIVRLGNPWVMGSITLAASGLVTWAFWPRHERQSLGNGRYHAGVAVAVVLVGVTMTALPTEPAQASETEVVTLSSSLNSDTRYELHPTEPLLWDLVVIANDTRGAGELNLSLSAQGDA